MKRKIIFLCSLVYFTSYFCRKNFAILMSDLIQNQTIEKSTGGLVCLALFVCYGIGQVISGYLGDKIKPKHMLSIGLIATGICNGLIITTSNPIFLIIVWGINGFAQSMLWPPIVRILSTNLNNEQYVKANLIVTSSAHIATILLYLYTPLCILYFNWQFVFITSSSLALLTFIIFIIGINKILSNSTQESINKESAIETQPLKTLFSSAPLVIIFFIIIAMGFLRDGIETWLPTLYQEAFNRTSSESILISIILPIFSILSITITTTFHKKFRFFNNELSGTAIFFATSSFISSILLLIIDVDHTISRYFCVILAALVCSVMHGCNFLLVSCIPGRFKNIGRSATASGFCNAFTYLGAIISTYGFAIISDNLGWSFTILSWVLVSILGITFSLLAKRKYTNYIIQNN